jgi:hypothetical protein
MHVVICDLGVCFGFLVMSFHAPPFPSFFLQLDLCISRGRSSRVIFFSENTARATPVECSKHQGNWPKEGFFLMD